MREREYKALCKAIQGFMSDDPSGWEDGMNVLQDLCYAYKREVSSRAKAAEAAEGE